MDAWLNRLPLPRPLKEWLILPLWHATQRLSKPEVRIVTGGISFYALFSIFPIVYLTIALLFALLPMELSQQLANYIDEALVSAVDPLSAADLDAIRQVTPQGLTFRAFLAILIVLYTASSGAKAAITGIRMVAGSEQRTRIIRFQGVSILMTALLILSVWLLGAAQLILSLLSQENSFIAAEVTETISVLASQLWFSKGIACFIIFYIIISLSLHSRVAGNRAKMAGATAGALAWLVVTWGYTLYLKFGTLDTFYGALASVILGFLWLAMSVSSLLLGAALTVEWGSRLVEGAVSDADNEEEDSAV